ncbi:hypothetical protein [Halobellus sp. EA9]|uniref:hypothetical protein n=1 Tax=Halobellus sp. EA9 TaxID=3421647 RepID=UPI003EBCBB5E
MTERASTSVDATDPGLGEARRSFGPFDRAAYALFASRADARRHERDRRAYRGTTLTVTFDLYLARVYALSWLAGTALALAVAAAVLSLSPAALGSVAAGVLDGVARVGDGGLAGAVPDAVAITTRTPAVLAGGLGLAVALGVHWGVVYAGGRYLRWLAAARRANIGRTLPSAVRYLNVLASGSDGRRAMLARVADTDAYGETAPTHATESAFPSIRRHEPTAAVALRGVVVRAVGPPNASE